MQEEEEEKKGSTEEQKGNIVFFSLALAHAERSINRSPVAYLIVGFPPSRRSFLLRRCRTYPSNSEEKIKRTSHHHVLVEQCRSRRMAPRAANRPNDRNDKI